MKVYKEKNAEYNSYENEYCFDIYHFKDRIYDGEEKIDLIEMKKDISGEMWCCEHDYFPDNGDCSRECKDYNPCNGKKGRCRFLKHGFVETDKIYRLTKEGLTLIQAGEKQGRRY